MERAGVMLPMYQAEALWISFRVSGYTAEEQLTGAAEHGGIPLIVYPMQRERYLEWVAASRKTRRPRAGKDAELMCCEHASEFGLAPGGLMRQELYEDRYGLSAWDTAQPSRCFAHILNSQQWATVTGKPVTANGGITDGRW